MMVLMVGLMKIDQILISAYLKSIQKKFYSSHFLSELLKLSSRLLLLLRLQFWTFLSLYSILVSNSQK